jgi:hypothetical protein
VDFENVTEIIDTMAGHKLTGPTRAIPLICPAEKARHSDFQIQFPDRLVGQGTSLPARQA